MCPAACPEPCPWGLSVGLDLGNDTLWKAPNMLSAWLWTQRCSSGGGGQGGKGGQLAAGTPPSGNRDRLLAPSQAPSLLSVLPSEQERRVLAPLCLCLGRDSPLQAPLGTGPLPAPHLACLHCSHSSCPRLYVGLSSLLSSPCSGLCASFSDSPGLCPEAGGATGLADWGRAETQLPPHGTGSSLSSGFIPVPTLCLLRWSRNEAATVPVRRDSVFYRRSDSVQKPFPHCRKSVA